MQRDLRISEALYEGLESAVRRHGLESIEQLLQMWQKQDVERLAREAVVRNIDALRSELQRKYGEMPDSTGLVREDRSR
jgi:hypothetical protein